MKQRHSILVVDDEPVNLRMLERLFRNDYDVITAENGAVALERLKEHEVSLIITDQRMPGMTGTELLKESLSMHPKATRIILTGYSDTEALIDAINTCRVFQYVAKPWEPAQLRALVKQAIELHEQELERAILVEQLRELMLAHQELLKTEMVTS